ncbi:MAG: kelch motif-containing protein [Thalassotalea sp.]|nr:kelch motif-containing protein [Thalassotalea sp.]
MSISKVKLALLSSLLLAMMLSGCSTKPSISTETFFLETSRLGHAAVNDGRRIYVLAGSNQSVFLSDIEIIDPVTQEIKVQKISSYQDVIFLQFGMEITQSTFWEELVTLLANQGLRIA